MVLSMSKNTFSMFSQCEIRPQHYCPILAFTSFSVYFLTPQFCMTSVISSFLGDLPDGSYHFSLSYLNATDICERGSYAVLASEMKLSFRLPHRSHGHMSGKT